MSDCVFCWIIDGKAEVSTVYEDDTVIGIMTIGPVNPGHVMVIPRKHYPFWPAFPERCLFLDGPIGAGPHHLHMTEFMSDFWQEKLLFGDFLLGHAEVAEEYSKLKKAWAAKYGADGDRYERYTEAKNGFIDSVLARARLELRSQRQTNQLSTAKRQIGGRP